MQSKEDVILFLGTRTIVGELDTRDQCLRGAMELYSAVMPGTDERGNLVGTKQINQVLPLFGFTGEVTISLTPELVRGAIRFADLAEQDASELAGKVLKAKAHLVEMRAQKAGIVLTKEMPRGTG